MQDGELVLSESPAILEYLAAKHGWHDLFPTDAAERAKLSSIMHWHHGNTRLLSAFFAARVRPDLVEAMGPDAFAARKAESLKALGLVESWLLADSPFLAGRSAPSLVDLIVYEEVGPLGGRWANLLDLAAYPKVEAWCVRMEALPAFEAAHAALAALGDVSAGLEPKQLGAATKAGLKALAAAQGESKL